MAAAAVVGRNLVPELATPPARAVIPCVSVYTDRRRQDSETGVRPKAEVLRKLLHRADSGPPVGKDGMFLHADKTGK